MKKLYNRYKNKIGQVMLRLVITLEEKRVFMAYNVYEFQVNNGFGDFKFSVHKTMITKNLSSYAAYMVYIDQNGGFIKRIIENFRIYFEIKSIYNNQDIYDLTVETHYLYNLKKPKLTDLTNLMRALEIKK